MISSTFNNSDTRLINRLRQSVPRVIENLRLAMDREMISLRSYIVTEKLSGQVLSHESGTLIDSTQPIPATVEGTRVTGGVTSAGGPAFYGRYFEEGGKGPYEIRPVNKKALAFWPSNGMVPMNQSITAAITRNLSKAGSIQAKAIANFNQLGGVVVKSVHHPAIPHLPYMKPSLEERRAQIVNNLQRAMINTVRSTR